MLLYDLLLSTPGQRLSTSRVSSLLVCGIGRREDDFVVNGNDWTCSCKTIVGGRLYNVLESSSLGGEELDSCLPAEDVDRKVTSIDHGPTVVRLAL